MSCVISLMRIRLADAYSLIKSPPQFKAYLIHRYCEGNLIADEVAYLFAKHHLRGV